MHLTTPTSAARTRTYASLAVLVAAATLTACASGAPDAPPSDVSQATLHPVGDAGRWFDDGYSEGISGTYATSNPVCGISDDIVIEMQTGPGLTTQVLARSMTRGDVLWEAADARCSSGAMVAESVLVERGSYADSTWQQLDISTGAPVEELELENQRGPVEVVSQTDGVLVVSTTEGTLIGLRDGVTEWTSTVASGAQTTALDHGYLGVLDGLGDRLQIIEGRTGEVVLSQKVHRGDWITWASDGYIEKINESDPEYAYFDLTGAEIERTVKSSQYRFVPSPRDGVTFPLADHIAAGRVVGVSADGIPSLYQDDQQRDHTRDGNIVDLPDSIISVRAMSSNGSLMLFTTETDPVLMIDGEGREVFSWPVPLEELRVESGYIVITSGPTTQVLLPAGIPE